MGNESAGDAARAPVRLAGLGPLVAALRGDGYQVIGPTLRDGAITLAELASADALPHGWGVVTDAGSYRLRRRDDRAAFGHATGPQSWKTFLHPPRERLFDVARQPSGDLVVTEPDDDPPRYAFLGVRPCDLRAIAILDRVLGRGADSRYAARRARVLVIAVNCTEPGETCFCAATGSGPAAETGYDLLLTELTAPAEPAELTAPAEPAELAEPAEPAPDRWPAYLAQAGTPAGERLLAAVPHEPAPPAQVAAAAAALTAAAGQMGRTLPPVDLPDLLAGTRTAARWEDVAQRCLTCANCTMVCPTCFCVTATDSTDLTGDHAQRWREWDSCFDLDYSYLHGGPVRASARSRYRQWLTHKFGTWQNQFGESGCVGCGRCIAWCPAGIDVTAELRALAAERAPAQDPAADLAKQPAGTPAADLAEEVAT